MKIGQKKWARENGWKILSDGSFTGSPELVLVFGGKGQPFGRFVIQGIL